MNDSKESLMRKEKSYNLLYIIPMMIVLIVFMLIPLIAVLKLSVYEKKITGDLIYVGFQNFIAFFKHPDTLRIMKNTAIWVFVGVFFKLFFGTIMALVLSKEFKFKKTMTAVVLIPWAIPAAVSCLTWRLMYNPLFGHITAVLKYFGITDQPINFLGNAKYSLLAVMIVNIWAVAPFCALNILSVLYSIPEYNYEAAEIDGANEFQKFWKITFPLIFPALCTLGLLIGIWGFNSFDVIFMMTEGGPANSSSILVTSIYQNAFYFNNQGFSSALSVISFVILSIFAIFYVRSRQGDVTYE